MRSSAALPLVIGLLVAESAYSFQQQYSRFHVASRTRIAASNEKDTLVPETSFGAEMVPEGQRPVNEYLDVIKSPMFGWASEESGTKGVSLLTCSSSPKRFSPCSSQTYLVSFLIAAANPSRNCLRSHFWCNVSVSRIVSHFTSPLSLMFYCDLVDAVDIPSQERHSRKRDI